MWTRRRRRSPRASRSRPARWSGSSSRGSRTRTETSACSGSVGSWRPEHSNADRLQLCRVDVGEGDPRQIVCGAWNFGEGATVAVALPGAVLLDGIELAEVKRGETSSGMILSSELDLGADHSGIMVLEDGPEPGTPLADVLPLTEQVLEIETTPNRPTSSRSTALPGRWRRSSAASCGRSRHGAGSRCRRARGHPNRGSRALPALRRPDLPRRQDRSVAVPLKARLIAQG